MDINRYCYYLACSTNPPAIDPYASDISCHQVSTNPFNTAKLIFETWALHQCNTQPIIKSPETHYSSTSLPDSDPPSGRAASSKCSCREWPSIRAHSSSLVLLLNRHSALGSLIISAGGIQESQTISLNFAHAAK